MALQLGKLYHTLRSVGSGLVWKVYAWNQEVHETFKLDSIAIKNLGTLNVPLTKEAVANMDREYRKTNVADVAESTCCTIEAENIVAPQAIKHNECLSQSAEQGIKERLVPGLESLKINVDVIMKSLIVCKTSETFVEITNQMHSDAFGIMLLQLPVGPESTVSAKVEDCLGQLKKGLDYQGKPPFYLTIFAGDKDSIKVKVKPRGEEPIVFLVFDLVWLDSYKFVRNPDPECFLSFLMYVKKANKALIEWEKMDVVAFDYNCSVDPRTPRGDRDKSIGNPLLDPQKTPALCIPTKHSYHSFELHMENLRGQDACMVNLLKLLIYVDVSIAILQFDKTKLPGPFTSRMGNELMTRERTFSVHRWIQGDWLFPALNEQFYSLHSNWHLVGDVTKDSEDGQSEEPPKKRAKLDSADEQFTYYPAIIIRPRKLAIFDCWKHSPVRAVQCLTERVNQALSYNYSKEGFEHHLILQEVNFILGLLVEDEDKMKECQRTAILHQFLYLCTLLKALDEGLKVLELIPRRQCECRERHKKQFAGFFSEENFTIEHVVTNFVILFGWEKCSSLVMGMYSRHENEDYLSLLLLSRAFNKQKLDCVDGAVYFVKSCLKILAVQDECKARDNGPHWNNINDFLDLSLSVKNREERKEIYTLLGRAAVRTSDILQPMIRFYFRNVNAEQDDLADLKAIIAEVIVQIDHYRREDTIFEIICFSYRTENAELFATMWSKLLVSGDDDEGRQGQFERMLSRFEYCEERGKEFLYKAIGASPLATDRFYKFIEGCKLKRDMETFNACFYHLTMAQREPSLASEQKLQSYISIFKEMNGESVGMAARAIVYHNEALDELDDESNDEPVHPISQSIISAFLECLPTGNDLVSLLHQDTTDFGHIMYCYVKLGTRNTHLRLIQLFKETLLNGKNLALTSWSREYLLLTSIWQTYLEMKLVDDDESTRKIAAYQALGFFAVYCDSYDYTLPMRPQVDAYQLRDFSSELTLQMLENVLTALYERERVGASECLKGEPNHWEICQELSDMLAADRELKTAILNFEPDRIAKLMCCIFWIESKFAIKKFVSRLKSLPVEKTRHCLSWFLVSSEELQMCAVSSSYAFSAIKGLVRHCLQHLFAIVGCSWSRRNVTIDRPEVVSFYESEEKSMAFGPFKLRKEADCFTESATKGLEWAHHVVSRREASFFCEIQKLYPADFDAAFSNVTPSIHQALNMSFKDSLGSKSETVSKSKCLLCLAHTLRATEQRNL